MKEHTWMGALLGRCVSYGLIAGFFFFCLSLLFLMSFNVLRELVWDLVPPTGNPKGWLRVYLTAIVELGSATVFTLLAVALMATMVGFWGGAIAGFHSPPREVGSAYLDTVLQSGSLGLGLGVLSGLLCGLILAVPLGGMVGFAVVLLLAFIGHAGGLWRGINGAIRRERTQEERHG